MTLSDIRSAVRTYLVRPNLDDARIDLAVGTTEGVLNRALAGHPRNRVQASYTTEEDGAVVPLPTDMARLVRVLIDGTEYRSYPEAAVPTTGYISRGTSIEVFPSPATGTVVSLDYYAFLPPLTAPADTNWVSSYFPDVYVYGVLHELAGMLKVLTMVGQYGQTFDRKLRELQDQGWGQNIGVAPRLTDV